jgi:hypothetical protein
VDENLFSGMIQGISAILQESVHRGSAKEILLDDAVMIFHRPPTTTIAFVLVSTKTSSTLRSSLEVFGQRFVTTYRKYITPEPITEVTPFACSELLRESFPFL